jgi:hypothetical protein
MPLPGTHVIPPGWSAHHRPTATDAQTSECTISRSSNGGGTTDPDGTWHPPTATEVYTGPCRVVPNPERERLLVVGDQQVTRRRYQVAIRYDTPEIEIDDLIAITAADDTGLIGRKLRVVDVTYSSNQWQRDLIADEVED